MEVELPLEGRKFSAYFVRPPTPPGGEVHHFGESISADLAWLILRQSASIPEIGRSLFAKPLHNQNSLWLTFGNFVRQGQEYWDAAAGLRSSSAALLHYYSALNLAKAELLVSNPGDIYEQKIQHGLSFNPAKSNSLRGDRVVVQKGVFPLLYKKRTGLSLKYGTELPVKRLFTMIPEVGLEVGEAGLGSTQVAGLWHALASDKNEHWPLIAAPGVNFLENRKEYAARAWQTRFEKISLPAGIDWRTIFAVSRRFSPPGVTFWQSKGTFGSLGEAASLARETLGAHASEPLLSSEELYIYPSLYSSREFLIPPELARYALMFYVSSLVRYKPDALDPVRQPAHAWVVDSFVKQASLPLLFNALGGIRNRAYYFDGIQHRA